MDAFRRPRWPDSLGQRDQDRYVQLEGQQRLLRPVRAQTVTESPNELGKVFRPQSSYLWTGMSSLQFLGMEATKRPCSIVQTTSGNQNNGQVPNK